MNIRAGLTDLTAKEAALRQYAIAQDHHSTQEQVLMGEGRIIEATSEHEMALWVLKGYRKELDNRPPAPAPKLALCGACLDGKCDGCRTCRVIGRET